MWHSPTKKPYPKVHRLQQLNVVHSPSFPTYNTSFNYRLFPVVSQLFTWNLLALYKTCYRLLWRKIVSTLDYLKVGNVKIKIGGNSARISFVRFLLRELWWIYSAHYASPGISECIYKLMLTLSNTYASTIIVADRVNCLTTVCQLCFVNVISSKGSISRMCVARVGRVGIRLKIKWSELKMHIFN